MIITIQKSSIKFTPESSMDTFDLGGLSQKLSKHGEVNTRFKNIDYPINERYELEYLEIDIKTFWKFLKELQ